MRGSGSRRFWGPGRLGSASARRARARRVGGGEEGRLVHVDMNLSWGRHVSSHGFRDEWAANIGTGGKALT